LGRRQAPQQGSATTARDHLPPPWRRPKRLYTAWLTSAVQARCGRPRAASTTTQPQRPVWRLLFYTEGDKAFTSLRLLGLELAKRLSPALQVPNAKPRHGLNPSPAFPQLGSSGSQTSTLRRPGWPDVSQPQGQAQVMAKEVITPASNCIQPKCGWCVRESYATPGKWATRNTQHQPGKSRTQAPGSAAVPGARRVDEPLGPPPTVVASGRAPIGRSGPRSPPGASPALGLKTRKAQQAEQTGLCCGNVRRTFKRSRGGRDSWMASPLCTLLIRHGTFTQKKDAFNRRFPSAARSRRRTSSGDNPVIQNLVTGSTILR